MGHFGTRRTGGRRVAVFAVLLALASSIAACSSGSATKPVALRTSGGGANATPANAAAAAAGAVTTIGPTSGPPGGAATTTPPTGGPTTTSHLTTPPGVPNTTAPVTTGPRTTAPGSTGPAPVAPGTYNYRLLGGSSTLTTPSTSVAVPVAASYSLTVSSGGNGTQQWSNPNGGTSLLFDGAGVFLQSQTVNGFGTNVTCTFNPAVPSPPWPLAVGKTFSGQAGCGLVLNGRVTGTASVPLDGGSVATFMVQTTMTMGSSLTIAETDWYAPSLRLPVKITTITNGSANGYVFATTPVTYLLTSSRPA